MNTLLTLLTLSREWSIVLAVLISLGSIVVFAVIAYLTFYFFAYKMMRKRSDWGKRAFFLILVSLIGLAIRLVCILSAGVHTFQDYLTYSVQTIYATIGVFSFEGQENTGLYDFLYFYATLWVAVTYVVVIFTGFNYSLQSRIALSLPKSKKTQFFIFTKVTDESYALAEGIERYYGKRKSIKIIFASDEIDTFDAKNELHKKIRSSGYYFVSIEKKASDKEKKPIIDSLGIKYWRLPNVRIFAMERDENDRGHEIRNSDIIFDDIECMIEKYNKKISCMKNDRYSQKSKDIYNINMHYIQYFIYVNNEVNSEFFDEMLKDKMPDDITAEKYQKIYKRFFRIKGFSEAQLSGLSLLKKRQEIESKRILESKEINANKDSIHRALVIGFGPNGQASLKNLYLDSASVLDGKDINARFEAHILDKNIESYAGVYELSHPSIIFNHGHEFLKVDSKNINLACIENAYKSRSIIEEMNFPVFNFYDIDCKGEGILELIIEKCKKGFFNSVIISMGTDDRNIELANALLRNIRQSVYDDIEYKEHPWKLDIYINLREENAYKRLYWNSKLEASAHPGINVAPYGDYQNMFTFENIISDEYWIKTSGIYNTLFDAYYVAYNDYANKNNRELLDAGKLIMDIDRYGENEGMILNWLKDNFKIENFSYNPSSYSRESSIYAHLFYKYYKAYFDSFGTQVDADNKQKMYDHCAEIEHVRWNRFIIMSGFIFSKNAKSDLDREAIDANQLYAHSEGRRAYSRECIKIHTDIVPTTPTVRFDKQKFGYDYMNVLAAQFFGQYEKED